MNEDVTELLSIYGGVSLCIADWQQALGSRFKQLKPLLVKCVGEITHSYPVPGTGIRLDVDRRGDRFLAYPVEDEHVDIEDIPLTLRDVQLWRLDADKVAAYLGHVKEKDTASQRPEARVIGSFQAILLPSGRKMLLGRKHKRRAFLRAVNDHCRAKGADAFFAQEVIEDYNASMARARQPHKAINSDRVIDDLFKGQKAEFNELFEVLDLAAGHFRLKMSLVQTRK